MQRELARSAEPSHPPRTRRHELSLGPAGRGLVCLPLLLGCVDGSVAETEEDDSPVAVQVTIDRERVLRTVPPWAYGMHASVYDNAIQSSRLPARLEEAGISLLRWPGGGYSDNYHWASHSMTPWYPQAPGERLSYGYLGPNTDFGSFAGVVERAGVGVMITANYGSNFLEAFERGQYEARGARSDGPGEPKEAAAWVAYANGDPEDTTEIGVDSVGNDWQTVGYWASMRAADKLDEDPNDDPDDDDGFDFLRISRPEPLGIRFWEIGNELFGNGYFGPSFNLDLSVPYDGTPREGNELLSGTAYGKRVVEYIQEMKAVDPDIEIGAVLGTPPGDSWGNAWNEDVLRECGELIDFGIIHWYPNVENLLAAPAQTIPRTFDALRQSFEEFGGEDPERIGVAVTEVGLGPEIAQEEELQRLSGLFAADTYLTYIRHGAFNVDWLELHNGTFMHEEGDRRGPAFHGIRAANMIADAGEQLIDVDTDDSDVRAHAGLGEDGELRLLLINEGAHRDAEVTIDGVGGARSAQLYRYNPEQRGAGLEGPETIELDAPLALPWHSLAVLIFERD